MAGSSAMGQICAAQGAADAETEASPQPSEQSIEQMDTTNEDWGRCTRQDAMSKSDYFSREGDSWFYRKQRRQCFCDQAGDKLL